ncbi:hypothetical protein NA57DRAFT_71110 [Rhizodiscina lignyota]|uniref:Thioesterase domain-containing protein n=1 Tax=Rhizodiscina lignyota TaxID=1504668 RepID=A0A9P4IPJ2_9PEZI|nr:hypothetical protein NA57DRAFT_71110 [Rhizodiscina lignyota]
MVAQEPERLQRADVPPDVAQRLRKIPWCAEILDDPSLISIYTYSRERKESTEDSLIAETFKSKDTIHTWETFYRYHKPSSDKNGPIGETITILGFGSGLNGHPKLLHGGTVAAVMDEVITYLGGRHNSPGMSGYTAFLKVDYKKPIPTPCTVLLRVIMEGRSAGRKQWLRGTLEDGNGVILATGESLVVEVPKNATKL